MQQQKLKPCNLIVLPNKKFKSIIFYVAFPYQRLEKDVILAPLLGDLLINTSRKYPKEELFARAKTKKYIMSYQSYIYFSYQQALMEYVTITPEPEVINQQHLAEVFNFMIDAIYDPYLPKNNFSEELLNIQKNIIYQGVLNNRERITPFARNRLWQLIDDVGYLKNNLYSLGDEIPDVTPSIIKEFYERTIINNQPLFIVMGNIEKAAVKQLLVDKGFTIKPKYQPLLAYDCFLKPQQTTINYVEETKNFHETAVLIACKVKQMTKEDKFLLDAVDMLISSQSSNIIRKFLRDDRGLTYSAGSMTMQNSGVLALLALTDLANKEAVIKQLKKVLKYLQNEMAIAPLLENVKEKLYVIYKADADHKSTYINNKAKKIFNYAPTSYEIYRTTKKFTAHDIALLAKRIKIDTILVVKGEQKHGTN